MGNFRTPGIDDETAKVCRVGPVMELNLLSPGDALSCRAGVPDAGDPVSATSYPALGAAAFNTKEVTWKTKDKDGNDVEHHAPDVDVYADPASPKRPGVGAGALFYRRDAMEVDFDGSPYAYAPGNHPYAAYAVDNLGNHVGDVEYQGADDPCPGFVLSLTSLKAQANSNAQADQVDALQIPFVVLNKCLVRASSNHGTTVAVGDFATVVLNKEVHISSRATAHAILGDVGPVKSLGEASYGMFVALGIRDAYDPPAVVMDPKPAKGFKAAAPAGKPRNAGADDADVLYIVYPGSGNGLVRTADEINTEGIKLFAEWGGATRVEELISVNKIK